MSDDLDDLLRRSRRVYRVTREGAEEPGLPPGFVERVQRNRVGKPGPSLVIWERAGLVGAIASVAIAAFVHLQMKGRETENAARAWMEMERTGEEEVIP